MSRVTMPGIILRGTWVWPKGRHIASWSVGTKKIASLKTERKRQWLLHEHNYLHFITFVEEITTVIFKWKLPYFPVMLFSMLYKVVLTFETADEILKCDHSNESYWAVLSRGAVYHAVQCCSKFVVPWSATTRSKATGRARSYNTFNNTEQDDSNYRLCNWYRYKPLRGNIFLNILEIFVLYS